MIQPEERDQKEGEEPSVAATGGAFSSMPPKLFRGEFVRHWHCLLSGILLLNLHSSVPLERQYLVLCTSVEGLEFGLSLPEERRTGKRRSTTRSTCVHQ